MPTGALASQGGPISSIPPRPDAPVPDHRARILDPRRLSALAETGLMDSEIEAAFDRFTKLAARWLGTPTAVISLVDDHRQFFLSAVGLSDELTRARQTPLSHSFCQYAVSSVKPLVVTDARTHPYLHDNLATTELGIVSYAGVPLVTSDEQVLGTLCVVDPDPRPWRDEEIEVLRDLAQLTMTEIELRAHIVRMNALRVERSKERRLLQAILDSMDDSIVVTAKDGSVLLANPSARRARASESLDVGKNLPTAGLYEPDGTTPLAKERVPLLRALRGEELRDVEMVIRGAGGEPRHLSINASPLRDDCGAVYAAVGVGRDVTVARQAQQALARSEAILRGVVRNLPNGAVLLFDHDLRYVMADGEQLLGSVGLSRESMVGKTLAEVASPEGYKSVEPLYRAALAGETRSAEIPRGDKFYAITLVPLRDDKQAVMAGLALIYDVTTHKRAEALVRAEANEMRSRSVRDELTGLYNRRGFLELARQHLVLAEQMNRPALLFFVDLNGMKTINDQLGHEQGDRALVETAEVLRTTFRGSDVIARLGGDEFVTLLMDGDENQLALFEGRVQREIDNRNAAPERAFRLSASIGGAAFDPKQPQSIDALLAKADQLMYDQKKARKAAAQ